MGHVDRQKEIHGTMKTLPVGTPGMALCVTFSQSGPSCSYQPERCVTTVPHSVYEEGDSSQSLANNDYLYEVNMGVLPNTKEMIIKLFPYMNIDDYVFLYRCNENRSKHLWMLIISRSSYRLV